MTDHIAIGGYASGHIAVGDTAFGTYEIFTHNGHLSGEQTEQLKQLKQLINQEFPHLWKPLADGMISIFK